MALPNPISVPSASLLVSRREGNKAPYPDKPLPFEIERFAEHVRKTGLPEEFDKIERVSPPENSTPVVLRKFDVDRNLRPLRDEAPCAICSPYLPKCLHDMLLVWYPDEGVIRAIGPDCGLRLTNSIEYKKAIADYELAERRRAAETTIEILLPDAKKRQANLRALRPAVAEATRLYKKLRRKGKPVIEDLRRHQRAGGQLVIEVVQDEDQAGQEDAKASQFGPAGYVSSRGTRSHRTQTQNFGPVAGGAFLAREFKHAENLETFENLAATLPSCGTVEEAFDWLCENEDLEEMENVAKLLRYLTEQQDKLHGTLNSIVDFFTSAFFYRLDQYGHHPQAALQISTSVENGSVFEIVHGANRRVRLAPDLDKLKTR